MAVENVYWDYVSDFGAAGADGDCPDSASWSLDINIPAQQAYASASLSYCSGAAWCGIMAYFTVDKLADGTEARVPHNPVPRHRLVVPAISADNVATVAFLYGARNGYADCHFQILGHGPGTAENTALASKPAPARACVLYDPQDGRVVHVHRAVTFGGAQEVTDREAGARGRERASQAGHDIRGLSILRAPAGDCDGASPYRVDVTQLRLTRIDGSAE